MRAIHRKFVLTPLFLLLALFLVKLNYTPDFQQNFPVYRAGRLILPPFFSLRGISGVSFSWFVIIACTVSVFIASFIPRSWEVFKQIFLRDKKAAAGLLILILTLVPDSDLCYKIVGFTFSSLVLFFILLYILSPVLLKAAPFFLRAKDAVLSLSTRKLVGGVFLAVLITTNIISLKVFQHFPHIYDGNVQLFQAKIFKLGKLTAKAPEPKKFFSYIYVILDDGGRGRWYSQYSPGHAFLLFLGLLINAPWLVNPFFGSLTVVLVYFLGRELYGEATGRLGLLLGAVSPYLLFMSSEFMNHTTAAFFLILGFYLMVRADKNSPEMPGPGDTELSAGKVKYPLLAGAALGMAHLIRPFSAFAVSVPLVGYFVIKWAKRRKWHEIGFVLLSLAFFAGLLMTYNTLTNGQPLLFGHKVLHKARQGIGFGYAASGYPLHTPRLGLRNMLNNINQLNLYLFQWPVPSLVFVAILLGSGRMRREDRLLLVCFLCLWGAFFFFWSQRLVFGPRYMYEGGFILILLTARGIISLKNVLGHKAEGTMWGVLALCVLVGLFHVRSLGLFYADDYCYFNPTLLKNIQKKDIKNAIVFSSSYHLVFAGVEPDLNAEVIFARDMGEEKNKELILRHPGRKLYRAAFLDLYPYYPFERIEHSRYH